MYIFPNQSRQKWVFVWQIEPYQLSIHHHKYHPSSTAIEIEIGFDPVLYSVNEADGTARLRITKIGNNAQPVSADFSTQAGSAMGECRVIG